MNLKPHEQWLPCSTNEHSGCEQQGLLILYGTFWWLTVERHFLLSQEFIRGLAQRIAWAAYRQRV